MDQYSQTQFVSALFDPEQPAPAIISAAHAERFQVYRNNVMVGLSESLYQSFPVLVKLLGSAYFRAVAMEFVRLHPPRSPIMARFGAKLPGFLKAFSPLAHIPYLADIGHLELSRIESFNAADAPRLEAAAYAALNVEQMISATIRLHPSLRWVQSDYPVFQLWRSQLDNSLPPDAEDWHGEDVMSIRSKGRVKTLPLLPGGALFLNSLAEGRSVAKAWFTASEVSPEFHLTNALCLLIEHELAVCFIPCN